MIPRAFVDEAIVLARKNYSEADRILVVYSKNHGKLSLLAKGVRRPISKKRGHLEVFSHIRFQAAKGRGLDILTEAETIENHPEIRKDLKKASVAYYFMEAVGRTTHENEKHTELFEILSQSLTKLKEEKNLKTFRLNFIVELLICLGFWPRDKTLVNPEAKLEEVTERSINSARVGKRLLG